MKNASPCMACDARKAGCHGSCEFYRNWKAEHDRNKAEKAQQVTEDYRFRSYRQTVYDRNCKIRKPKSER